MDYFQPLRPPLSPADWIYMLFWRFFVGLAYKPVWMLNSLHCNYGAVQLDAISTEYNVHKPVHKQYNRKCLKTKVYTVISVIIDIIVRII